ncbi:hypothetical protein G7046_g5068 [Stylonectria norvegica]|nr:hypothetical protein G7046_g5068 [Stylonectria norvegica]
MYLPKLVLLVSMIAASVAAPVQKRADILQVQDYAQFQISDGVAGKALQEVAEKFPVDQFRADLAGVSKNDLAVIQAARETAEAAETDAGGFNDAIEQVGEDSNDGKALSTGKIKNKVLKLELEVLALQIQQAQGEDNQDKIDQEQKKLDNNVATDQKNAGNQSQSVNFVRMDVRWWERSNGIEEEDEEEEEEEEEEEYEDELGVPAWLDPDDDNGPPRVKKLQWNERFWRLQVFLSFLALSMIFISILLVASVYGLYFWKVGQIHKMPPTTCPLCYNLDFKEIRLLTRNTCSMGQTARHWMNADDLRASAAGISRKYRTDSSGPSESSQPCDGCALLKDAVQTLFSASGLTDVNINAFKYQVAVQDPQEDDEEPAKEESARESDASSSSWKEVDDVDSLDGEPNAASHASSMILTDQKYQSKTQNLRRLKLIVRCNLIPEEAGDRDSWQEEFELEVFTLSKDVSPAFFSIKEAGEVLADPGSYGYAAAITRWLQECLEEHTTCKGCSTISNPMPLPRRVLDVSDDKVVLIETGLRKDLYVALSHCWGKDRLLVTTNETLPDRMKDIPLDIMPRTFRDAVVMTRALGLRYLWIDSLCIIQGDPQDWEEQSAVMADIYANCYLNIATTRSANGSQGFLGPRWTSRDTWRWAEQFVSAVHHEKDAKPISRVRQYDVGSFPVTSHDKLDRYSRDLRVRLTLNSSHEAMQTFRWIHAHDKTAPLIQRGWVYQERTLAPRTVHFHANEMVWDCADQQRCECSTLDNMKIGGDGWSASKNRISTLSSLDHSQLHGLWRTVVEDYSLLDLTFELDRLSALGGLAFRFSKSMPQDECLAGLWRSSLGRDLLWKYQTEPKQPRRRQLGKKSPPSWSWASLVYGRGFEGLRWEYETKPRLSKWAELFTYTQDQRFSVLKASVELAGLSPFGAVSGGSITVQGAMCAISLTDDIDAVPPGWAAQIPIRPEGLYNTLHFHYDDSRDKDEVMDPKSPGHGLIFCLFIGTFNRHFDMDLTKNTHPSHEGLILRPSTSTHGAAERIGSWGQYIEHYTEGKELFFKNAMTVVVTIV